MVEALSQPCPPIPGHHNQFRSNSVNRDSMDGKGKCTWLCARSRHWSSSIGMFKDLRIFGNFILFTQILGIAQGLHYLHNHSLGPIIHGDMKGVSVSLLAWTSNNFVLVQHPDIWWWACPHSWFWFLTVGKFFIFHFWSRSTRRYIKLDGTRNAWKWWAIDWNGCIGLRNDSPGMFDIFSFLWSWIEFVQELFTWEAPFHHLYTPALFAHIFCGLPHHLRGEKTCFHMADNWWQIPLDKSQVNHPLMPELHSFFQEELALKKALREFLTLASSCGFDLNVEI